MHDVIGIHEKLPLKKTLPLSLQHLTAMFGATVLVPTILGIDPGIVLLMNGIGTLLYSFVTKGGIPAYLGSSFAFIAPSLLIISSLGFSYAQFGYIFFGLFFIAMSFIISKVGIKWIDIVMPPAVMSSVVCLIGLELVPIAASQAGLISSNTGATFSPDPQVVFVSLSTLAIAIIGTVVFRGFAKIIPIFIAAVAGYLIALVFGMVDINSIANAAWFAIPHFSLPKFNISAVLIILPACLVVFVEHISHLLVTSKVTGEDLLKSPGLSKSLLGDGLSNVISGFFGSTPNTTYGENIGVMAITKVYSVWVIRGAAIFAICFSVIGKVSAVISSIPEPVMGGITLYLYGVIAISGFRMFIEQKVDFSKGYNMILSAVPIVIGLSGASFMLGSVEISGMSLAAVVGVCLSLLFYTLSKLGLMNEEYKPGGLYVDDTENTLNE